MRSYATSKIRIILLGVMLATGVFVASGYAQDTPTGGAAAKPVNTSLFSVIMSNTDPVFFTILLLTGTITADAGLPVLSTILGIVLGKSVLSRRALPERPLEQSEKRPSDKGQSGGASS